MTVFLERATFPLSPLEVAVLRSCLILSISLLLCLQSVADPSKEVNVQGHVIDRFGCPIAHAQLIVGGQDVISQEDGSFLVQQIERPYELTYVGPPIISYLGLTTSHPTVVAPAARSSVAIPSLVYGHVPLAAGELARLVFTAPGITAQTVADRTGYFALKPRFNIGDKLYKGTLFVLRIAGPTRESPRKHHYTSIASREIHVDGGSSTAIDFTVNEFFPTELFHIRGSVVRPPSSKLISVTALLDFEEESLFAKDAMRPLADTFDVLVPFLPGVDYAISASTFGTTPTGSSPNNATVRGLRPPVRDLTLVLFPGPELVLPERDMTDVVAPRFSWHDSPGPGIYELRIQPPEISPGYTSRFNYTLYVADTTATVHHLPRLRFDMEFDRSLQPTGLVPGEKYYWSVRKIHSLRSVDEAATLMLRHKYSSVASSLSRRFTVQESSSDDR